MEIIALEGERLTGLINDFLDLARLEAGKVQWQMAPVAMAPVLEQAVQALSVIAQQKDLPLYLHIRSPLPPVNGDRDRLYQVVINLLANGVKFTDAGSVTCSAEQRGEELVVSVADTGIGIGEADQLLVFDKFKQVGDAMTNRPQGTGLGLAICRQIIEYHGGRIWLESSPGAGSIFSFSLPLPPAPA
jgi:signal transduction histidine kinase